MKTLALVLAVALCSSAAQAVIPQTMSYQGVLRDASGNVVPDASYSVTFSIYAVDAGGTALWSEGQTLPAADGIINATLGHGVPLALPFDTTYWLGISIEGEAELSPRTELTSAPYAQRAAYADVGADTDWTIDGDDIYRLPGNVGIGLPTPTEKLDVEGTVKAIGFQLATAPAPGHVLTSDATGVGTWQPVDPLTLPYSGEVGSSIDAFAVTNSDSGTAVRGHASGTGEGGFFSVGNVASDAAALHAYTDGTGPALYSHAAGGGKAGHFEGDVYVDAGSLGIGVPNPAASLDVAGTAKVTGFQLTDTPSPGYVLMSDATGVGTWQPAAGNIGGGGTADYVPKFTGATTIGNSIIYETGGQVAIGTTTAGGKLTVENAASEPALRLTNTSSGPYFSLFHAECTADMQTNDVVARLVATENSTGGLFLRCDRVGQFGSYGAFWVDLDGGVYSIDEMDITSDTDKVVDAYSYHASDNTRVVSGVYGPGGGAAFDATGVYGESKPQDYYGYGGKFVGGYVGAKGSVEATGGEAYYGLQGTCDGGPGNNFGVVGQATGSGANFGIYGYASGSGINWAGYFDGDVNVTGTFYNPASALLIDHPLDPAEQYLRQPAVHSSEMKNIYDGVVALDGAGEAWVELPDWFDALNTDFRYQLTSIGAPGPNLYVADEVAGNRFRIAGGVPGMKVSWLVTGVRHDAHARANPIAVEEHKREDESGMYLQPEAHGVSPALGIGRLGDADEKLKTSSRQRPDDPGPDRRRSQRR